MINNDDIDLYVIKCPSNDKKYKCELCEYECIARHHMKKHIISNKHIQKSNSIPKSIPIEIPIKQKNDSPKNSPNEKLKGKTFLSTLCSEATKYNVSLPFNERYEKQVIFDEEDLKKWGCLNPNDYLIHIFNKMILKEGGINNFFFRCVDENRKRFYYNDSNIGWTEDLLNFNLIRFIRNLFANLNHSAYVNYTNKGGKPNENFLNKQMIYMFWGIERESSEDSINKSKKQASYELNEAIELLTRMLEI
jgi:hypothetical protein